MKIGRIVCLSIFICLVFVLSLVAQEGDGLYPVGKALRSGFLKVSDIHSLYWEVSGNEAGIPVIGLHGGPGGSAGPDMRRFFDPEKYKIILFDQRGAGRSKPTAEIKDNTTQLLVEDINKIRDHLGVKGKAILFGGSWGSTLAVAYAEAYPQLVSGMVLRGIFLASKAEIDHFYHGGTKAFFPENFKKLQSVVKEPDTHNYPEQLFKMTQSQDKAERDKAIKGWAYYEIRMVSMTMTDEFAQRICDQYDMTSFSVMENYYMMNGCFLKDRQLIDNAHKIAHIPTWIVNGRYDAICPPVTAVELASKLKNVHLDLPVAAHSQREESITKSMFEGVKWVTARIK